MRQAERDSMSKFKIGEVVKAHYIHGNGGKEFTIVKPLIGRIDSIGTHANASPIAPYHVEGFVGCWSEDELERIKQERVLVYGSLRKGMSNHGMLKNATYLRDVLLDGYVMYSLGGYPCITKATNKGEGSILCELYEISTEDLRPITGMELGAGYNSTTIELEDGEAVLYDYSTSAINEMMERRTEWGNRYAIPVVGGGDWVDYHVSTMIGNAIDTVHMYEDRLARAEEALEELQELKKG